MYGRGRGATKRYSEAIKWYRQAARQGHLDALYRLGLAYACGHGVVRDYRRANAYFQQAAARGHAWAQYNMGVSFIKGQGVVKDPVKAYAWFLLAEQSGHSAAGETRRQVEAVMTEAQVVEAQDLLPRLKPH